MTIEAIDQKAAEYKASCELVEKITQKAKDDIRRATKRHLTLLEKAVADKMEHEDELLELIEENASLFKKPKSRTIHEVQLGFRKQKGKLKIANEEKTIEKIKQHFKNEYLPTYIKTEEKALKNALEKLPGNLLKRLGVTLEDDTDKPFIKIKSNQVDDILNFMKLAAHE